MNVAECSCTYILLIVVKQDKQYLFFRDSLKFAVAEKKQNSMIVDMYSNETWVVVKQHGPPADKKKTSECMTNE